MGSVKHVLVLVAKPDPPGVVSCYISPKRSDTTGNQRKWEKTGENRKRWEKTGEDGRKLEKMKESGSKRDKIRKWGNVARASGSTPGMSTCAVHLLCMCFLLIVCIFSPSVSTNFSREMMLVLFACPLVSWVVHHVLRSSIALLRHNDAHCLVSGVVRDERQVG